MALPKHVAIIMDGNGRWAQARGHQRFYGHVKGAITARKIIRECGNLGVKYLTLYAFSTENWLRPQAEVNLIWRILEKYLQTERKTLTKDNVRFSYIGHISRLPERVIQEVQKTVEITSNNTGLNLIFALNYGGRQELIGALKRIGRQIKEGSVEITDINESFFTSMLDTATIPDPDLLIRTSGEFRISNFLLWQLAYTEFYITPTTWPDFSTKELQEAFRVYSQRERRFGKTSAQVSTLDLPKFSETSV